MRQTASGLRRHFVTLENPTGKVPDADGGWTETWADLNAGIGFLASIVPATARDLERVAPGTVIATASHLVTIPYVAGVSTLTRVKFGSRVFHVTGVQNPEERNIELILVCEEVVS